MKHILNEMNDEERNSIRSQYTGTLSVQTGKFKQLVENKLGNAKPLVSEIDDDDDFEFESPFCKSCEGTGCEECDGSGMKRNSIFPDSEENELEEDDSDYRMYDLPSIHQDIEDELMEMSDDDAIDYLKEIIEFCEDKLNSYDSEEDSDEEEEY